MLERSRLQHSKSSVFQNIRSASSYKRIVVYAIGLCGSLGFVVTTGVPANACCMYEETRRDSQTANRPAVEKGAHHAP